MTNIEIVTRGLIARVDLLAKYLEAHQCPQGAKLAHLFFDGLNMVPIELLYFVVILVGAKVLIGLVLAPLAGFSTYVERRVAARMQSRVGCNRVGPEGLLQFLADGIKLITKEDTIPKGADQVLFRLAPYLVICGAFLSFVCIPFGKHLLVSDINVGVVYLMAISSLVVVGILMAGWASNNKWSLLGSMRSAAQIVSYEIPVGLALMVPVLMVGSLSLQELNMAQSGGFRTWIITQPQFFPIPLIAAVVYFIAALAEVNRTPFDLPEAESELVAGYNTEYSGIRWGLFFVAEYTNIFLVSAILVTAFMGGWQPSKANFPFGAAAMFFTLMLGMKSISYFLKLVGSLISGKRLVDLLSSIRPIRMSKPLYLFLLVASLVLASLMMTVASHPLIAFLFFVAKVYFFVFVIIWIRWTLPRIRIDQMMSLCWKKLVPISFFCILYVATAMVFWA